MLVNTLVGFDIAMQKHGMAFLADYDGMAVRKVSENEIVKKADGTFGLKKPFEEGADVYSNKEEADNAVADWIDKYEIPSHKGEEKKKLIRLSNRIHKGKNKLESYVQGNV
jgi:hypothetical protein